MDKQERMNSDIGALYNDYMQEAHSGDPGKYTTAERKQRVRELLEKGALTQGIDLYHAALLIENEASPDDRMQAFQLYKRAGQLGYEIGYHAAASAYDSWLIAQGRKQLYGTHWSWQVDENGNPVTQPIEDPDHVDARRAELHLNTLAEEAAYVAELNRMAHNPRKK